MPPAKSVVGVRITHTTRTTVGLQPRCSAMPPQTPAMTLLVRERCRAMEILLFAGAHCKRRTGACVQEAVRREAAARSIGERLASRGACLAPAAAACAAWPSGRRRRGDGSAVGCELLAQPRRQLALAVSVHVHAGGDDR